MIKQNEQLLWNEPWRWQTKLESLTLSNSKTKRIKRKKTGIHHYTNSSLQKQSKRASERERERDRDRERFTALFASLSVAKANDQEMASFIQTKSSINCFQDQGLIRFINSYQFAVTANTSTFCYCKHFNILF